MNKHAKLAAQLAYFRKGNFIFALIFMTVLILFTLHEYHVKDSFRVQSNIEQLTLQARYEGFDWKAGEAKIVMHVEAAKKQDGYVFSANDIRLLNEYYRDLNQYHLEEAVKKANGG